MTVDTVYGELEIGLHRVQRGAHEVVLRLTDPHSQAELAPVRGPAAIDAEALLAAQAAPEAYGRLLAGQLFADAAVRGLYATARAALERGGLSLRVRLAIDPSALELHDLRWELFRSPRRRAAGRRGHRLCRLSRGAVPAARADAVPAGRGGQGGADPRRRAGPAHRRAARGAAHDGARVVRERGPRGRVGDGGAAD